MAIKAVEIKGETQNTLAIEMGELVKSARSDIGMTQADLAQ